MKIGIQTWGSNGDIRPMIALAEGLNKAGHTVTLAVTSLDNRCYAEECAVFNINYLQIPERIDFDLEAFAQKTFRMNTQQWLEALLDNAFFPYEAIIYQTSKQLAENNDLVIGHHFLYPLKMAAIKQNKPFYSVTFCHTVIPSLSQPPFRFPNLGKQLNSLQWRLLGYGFDFFFIGIHINLYLNTARPLFITAGQEQPTQLRYAVDLRLSFHLWMNNYFGPLL